jgi:hypothetical protein
MLAMLRRSYDSVRSRVLFWVPKPVETVLRCNPEGLEQFLQGIVDLAQSRSEQVAWGKIKAVREISIGASLRFGDLFLVIDAGHRGEMEFKGDRSVEGERLRHAAALALYEKLTVTYGMRPDAEVSASMRGQ